MNQTIALITLAVEDLPRALVFYRDGLGWTPKFETEHIAFFQMNGFVFSLFRKAEFAKEAGGNIQLGGTSIALAHNVPGKDDVDAVLNEVRGIKGATILSEPVDHDWGGYSGYFRDPDGHVWEVAWNPHWTIAPDGSVTV